MPTRVPGRPNLGTGAHSDGSSHNPLVDYVVAGAVRWLDRELARIVVHVDSANGHAGSLLGRDLTVDFGGAKVTGGEPLPGTVARVKIRLPRSLNGSAPDVFGAASVAVAAA